MTRTCVEAERVMCECLRRGLSFKDAMGNILQLKPALTVTREQMTRVLDILEDALRAVKG